MVHVCLLPILVGIYLVTPHYLASHPQCMEVFGVSRPPRDRWTRLANPYNERMRMSGWVAEGREEVPEGE